MSQEWYRRETVLGDSPYSRDPDPYPRQTSQTTVHDYYHGDSHGATRDQDLEYQLQDFMRNESAQREARVAANFVFGSASPDVYDADGRDNRSQGRGLLGSTPTSKLQSVGYHKEEYYDSRRDHLLDSKEAGWSGGRDSRQRVEASRWERGDWSQPSRGQAQIHDYTADSRSTSSSYDRSDMYAAKDDRALRREPAPRDRGSHSSRELNQSESSLFCEVCGIHMDNKYAYDLHCDGMLHEKNLLEQRSRDASRVEEERQNNYGGGSHWEHSSGRESFQEDGQYQQISAQDQRQRQASQQDQPHRQLPHQDQWHVQQRRAYEQEQRKLLQQDQQERPSSYQDQHQRQMSQQDQHQRHLSHHDQRNRQVSQQDQHQRQLSQDQLQRQFLQQEQHQRQLSQQDQHQRQLSQQDQHQRQLSQQDQRQRQLSHDQRQRQFSQQDQRQRQVVQQDQRQRQVVQQDQRQRQAVQQDQRQRQAVQQDQRQRQVVQQDRAQRLQSSKDQHQRQQYQGTQQRGSQQQQWHASQQGNSFTATSTSFTPTSTSKQPGQPPSLLSLNLMKPGQSSVPQPVPPPDPLPPRRGAINTQSQPNQKPGLLGPVPTSLLGASPAQASSTMSAPTPAAVKPQQKIPMTTAAKKDPKAYHCEVCDVKVTGDIHLDAHLKGERHKRNVKVQEGVAAKVAESSLQKSQDQPGESNIQKNLIKSLLTGINCRLCDFKCEAYQSFEDHMKSASHIKKYKTLELQLGKAKFKQLYGGLPFFKSDQEIMEYAIEVKKAQLILEEIDLDSEAEGSELKALDAHSQSVTESSRHAASKPLQSTPAVHQGVKKANELYCKAAMQKKNEIGEAAFNQNFPELAKPVTDVPGVFKSKQSILGPPPSSTQERTSSRSFDNSHGSSHGNRGSEKYDPFENEEEELQEKSQTFGNVDSRARQSNTQQGQGQWPNRESRFSSQTGSSAANTKSYQSPQNRGTQSQVKPLLSIVPDVKPKSDRWGDMMDEYDRQREQSGFAPDGDAVMKDFSSPAAAKWSPQMQSKGQPRRQRPVSQERRPDEPRGWSRQRESEEGRGYNRDQRQGQRQTDWDRQRPEYDRGHDRDYEERSRPAERANERYADWQRRRPDDGMDRGPGEVRAEWRGSEEGKRRRVEYGSERDLDRVDWQAGRETDVDRHDFGREREVRRTNYDDWSRREQRDVGRERHEFESRTGGVKREGAERRDDRQYEEWDRERQRERERAREVEDWNRQVERSRQFAEGRVRGQERERYESGQNREGDQRQALLATPPVVRREGYGRSEPNVQREPAGRKPNIPDLRDLNVKKPPKPERPEPGRGGRASPRPDPMATLSPQMRLIVKQAQEVMGMDDPTLLIGILEIVENLDETTIELLSNLDPHVIQAITSGDIVMSDLASLLTPELMQLLGDSGLEARDLMKLVGGGGMTALSGMMSQAGGGGAAEGFGAQGRGMGGAGRGPRGGLRRGGQGDGGPGPKRMKP